MLSEVLLSEFAVDPLLKGIYDIPEGRHFGPLPLGDLDIKPRFEAADDQRKAHGIYSCIGVDDSVLVDWHALHVGHTLIDHFFTGRGYLVSVHGEIILSRCMRLRTARLREAGNRSAVAA